MGNFSATVKDFSQKTKEAMDTILREATEDTVQQINLPRAKGGPMPVDTGFLRNSMAADINGSGEFSTVKPATKDDAGSGSGAVSLLINDFEGGQIMHIAWTAVYAARVNYGYVGEDSLGRNYANPGAGFIESGAARWPHFVDEAVERNKV